ncbi:MAG: hypothetical protein NZ519_08720 [Bacteroidia bacterium]|nr:hypothetical protein [Bacteroidia bacterium]
MGISLALMPTRSACYGLGAECPDPCAARGTPKKSNHFLDLIPHSY